MKLLTRNSAVVLLALSGTSQGYNLVQKSVSYDNNHITNNSTNQENLMWDPDQQDALDAKQEE